ncbi:MAG: hypothetical protein IT377_02195 [Polyangiaceae bacterium]|nr:hypothetical protein [Polyangiaceae bacterium]
MLDAFGLIVVGAALWWFDGERFWEEARRVLRADNRVVVLATVPGEEFYEVLRPFEVAGRRKPAHYDTTTVLHGLPPFVGLRHFEGLATSMTLEGPRQLADMARSIAPPGTTDALWNNLEDFDGGATSWPLTLPCISPVAVLEVLA